MKTTLKTLDVLRLLEGHRAAADPNDAALVRETVAQCEDLIAQRAGYSSRTEWYTRLLDQDRQMEALALCKSQVELADYEIIHSGHTSFDVGIHSKSPHTLQEIVSHYPSLEVWVPDEKDWELCTVAIR